MKTKRANGNGSVFQRKGDGLWVAAVVDPLTGKQERRYAKTKNAADAKLREMSNRVASGVITVDKSRTLSAHVEVWLAHRAESRRRSSTVREYERCLRTYVLPALGSKRLTTITTPMVEDVLDTMAAKGLSRSTVNQGKKALAAALSDAVRDRLLGVNVASAARLPEILSAPKPVQIPEPSEVQALMDKSQGTELGRLLILITYTGVRIGEALGAKWADFELDAGSWTIERTTTLDRKGRIVLGTRTKTGATRTVPLTAHVVESLREQRRQVTAARLRAFAWADLDLVFPSSTGTVMEPTNMRRQLKIHTKELGYPGAFHTLRHYTASVGLATATPAQVSRLLGHANTRTTLDVYGHLLHSVAVEITDAVADSLSQKRLVQG